MDVKICMIINPYFKNGRVGRAIKIIEARDFIGHKMIMIMVALPIRQVYNILSWWTTLLQKEFIGCLFTINMCTNTVYQSSPGLIFFGFWEVCSTDNHSSNKRKSELFQGTLKLVINGFQVKKTTLPGTNRAP